MLRSLARLFGAHTPVRPPVRFVPGLAPLEGRDVPATLPFQETLAVVGVDPSGVVHYAGTASHLGRVTAVLNPDDTFVKTAASGDTLSGFVTHVTATTGTITYTAGTGRLYGTTGLTSYVLGADGGVTITGTLDTGRSAGVATTSFKISGSGPAPLGLPLFPAGSSGPHAIDSGVATQLGRYTGTGTFQVGDLSISATGAVTGTFQGSFVFVAANGDRLAYTYGDNYSGVFTGQLSADGLSVAGVTFDAVFTYDAANSTGRFANLAGGSLRMIAQANGPLALTYNLGLAGPNGNPLPDPYTQPFTYSWVGEGTLEKTTGKK